MKKSRWNRKCMLCMLPSILGTLIFFVVPYFRMVYYSLLDNQFRRNFVGLRNYIRVVKNQYFLLASKNSILLILLGVPVLVLAAVILSLFIRFYLEESRWKWIRYAFILPMFLPTAAVSLIWRELFSEASTALPVYTLYWWKNMGISIILLVSAFSSVNPEILQSAKIDGAGNIKRHIFITLPMNMPIIIFVTLLGIVNSFRIFKESYLFYGNHYPPDYSYTLQYYINNNFYKLNYQILSSSAIITSLYIALLVFVFLKWQKRYQL